MSDMPNVDKTKVAMREKNSTNLNTSGKDNVPFCARPQVKNVTPYASKRGGPNGK
jgi:hypothetical protein